MLNLVVARTVAGSPGQIMRLETFEQVMTALEASRQKEVLVHADPPEAQPHLEQMTARLEAGGFRVTLCVNGGRIDPNSTLNTGVICNAHALSETETRAHIQTSAAAGSQERGDAGHSELFVAMSSPQVSTDLLLERANAMHRPDTVVLGVGWADWGSGPQRIAPQCFPVWAAKVLDVVSAFTDMGVKTRFACGVPLCLFSRQQLGHLVALKVTWPIAWCAPQFHVEPDGEVRYCSHLAGPRRIHITDSQPFEQLTTFADCWASMRAFCGRPNAASCRSLATSACAAGCLVHLLADWQGMPIAAALPQAEIAAEGK